MTDNLTDVPRNLLPSVPGLRIDGVAIDTTTISCTVAATHLPVVCPLCATATTRLHSHYTRTMADLPWGGHTVRVHLRVRRFRCAEPTCRRRVFTERVPLLVAPSARRTVRLRAILQVVAVALGGEAGARLVDRLSMPASAATLLRAIRQAPLPSHEGTVIGVDDFALRRGQRYGTVIVDLERHRPLDILPDRSAPTLTAWLLERPVSVIARDRSTEYARGIAAGAPQATEVLDRWHLHQNVREAVERVLNRHQQEMGVISLPPVDVPMNDPDVLPAARSRGERVFRTAKRVQREERYAAVQDLQAKGISWREIGRQLGLSRWTVRRFASATAFPERQPHRRLPSMLDPYLPYLVGRWAEGSRNGMQLWRELRARGYPGSPKRVRQWVQQRRTEPAATDPVPRHARVPRPIPRLRAASTRRLSWLMVRDPASLTSEEQAAVTLMTTRSEAIRRAYDLARAFIAMLHERTDVGLDGWFAAVASSGVTDLQTFAASLRREEAALRNALLLPWSNGMTEGFVNKIKTIKRQMYGRASLDLLRRRVLLAA
jgi:transposase